MVVPASSTSITRSAEFTSRSINWVSFASDKLFRLDVLPARAFIIKARLLMLFDAGSNDAVPRKTGDCLSRMDALNVLIFFFERQVTLSEDFLLMIETNPFKRRLNKYL